MSQWHPERQWRGAVHLKVLGKQCVLSHLFSIKDCQSPRGISMVWSLEPVNQGLTRFRGSSRWKFWGWEKQNFNSSYEQGKGLMILPVSWCSHHKPKYFMPGSWGSGHSFIDFGQRQFQEKSKCLKVLTITRTYSSILLKEEFFSPLPQIGLS